jgi:hypothetical protein
MSHEVISAFVDREPFDAEELGRALADPAGRDLLIDLIALRQLVASDALEEPRAAAVARRPRPLVVALAAAATIALAVAGGYVAGTRLPARTSQEIEQAPAPTQVIDLTPGKNWHPNEGGR